jgi:ABC-type glycerol-3-phosphate transport system substrate-binding protein
MLCGLRPFARVEAHRFASAAALVAASCGGGDDEGAAPTDAAGSEPAAATTGAPADTTGDTSAETSAATSGGGGGGGGGGGLEMWERSGGNAAMVDALVAAWNGAEPDRPINLTYIPHDQMVPKLAQAIASGDVPDLMGLDLIYGPQFASAGQLEDITDLIGDVPLLETIPEGHRAVATWEDRLYGVPLYAHRLDPAHAAAERRARELPPRLRRRAVLGLAALHVEVHDPDHSDPHRRRLPAGPADRRQHPCASSPAA